MKSRWILLASTVLFLWVVISRFTELEQLKNTLASTQWMWLFGAFLTQIAYYIVFSGSYQAAFSTVGIHTRTRELIPVTLGSLFVNVVVPAGGTGGAALFAEDLVRRGKPGARAATGLLIQLISDFCAFILLLIPGLIYLFSVHDLKIYEIIAAGVLLLVTLSLTSILLLSLRRPDWLHYLFRRFQRAANWIFGRFNRSLTLADDWAQRNTDEFKLAASAAASHPSQILWTLGTSFLAHCLDLLTLTLLFQAFNHPISLGVLIAGYSIGILFWIVSITPQGIGVVEGMMALTFTSLGVPGAIAAAIALTFRGLTFWLPMLLGFIAVQRMHRVSEKHRSLTVVWGVRFVAIMVALMGLVNMISATTPSLSDRMHVLRSISPLEVQRGGHLTAALAGFALLLLAHGLWRRKHIAWLLTLITLGVSIVGHMVKGLDYEESLLALGLIIVLWLTRARFHARSDTPSVRQGLGVLAGAALFTLAYGVTGFFLLDKHYSVNFGFWAAFRQTVVMFTQFYDPGLNAVTHYGRFFAVSVYAIGIITFAYAGFMLLRPVFIRVPATAEERGRAKGIVEAYGHSSLAFFLLFNDKHYYFSSGGSVIGFAVIGNTAVALGDPVGPPDDLRNSIHEFSAYCQKNDWLPVFYQTLPATFETYDQLGFDALGVGHEGIVNLETFTIEGKEGKPLRSPINKLTHAGYKFMIYQPPLSDEVLEELRAISDEWLTFMHGSEKKFSLGWFEENYIRNSVVGAVLAPEGWITAFANLVPEYQLNEASIDLMRRRKHIENGTMEFLFVSLFNWAKSQGYQGFNLGLSPLSGVGERVDDPLVEKVVHWIYEHVNQFYNFKGLHAFKEKFNPEWSPRYLIYPGNTNLVQAWMAVVRANSGGGGLLTGWFKKKTG